MHPVTHELINATLLVNDEHFGERFVGTRNDFRAALEGNFLEWYADYEGEMSFDEYVDESLDAHLWPASGDDIAECERINA